MQEDLVLELTRQWLEDYFADYDFWGEPFDDMWTDNSSVGDYQIVIPMFYHVDNDSVADDFDRDFPSMYRGDNGGSSQMAQSLSRELQQEYGYAMCLEARFQRVPARQGEEIEVIYWTFDIEDRGMP